jgi:hypothetical protein
MKLKLAVMLALLILSEPFQCGRVHNGEGGLR